MLAANTALFSIALVLLKAKILRLAQLIVSLLSLWAPIIQSPPDVFLLVPSVVGTVSLAVLLLDSHVEFGTLLLALYGVVIAYATGLSSVAVVA
eukprot:jgi/Chrzof1/4125/Cz14g00030.t1